MSQPYPYGPQHPHSPQAPMGTPPGQSYTPQAPGEPGANPYTAPQSVDQGTPPVQTWWPTATAEAFAPCPRCGCNYAERVKFSWWGGVLGPKLFTHVKCCNCAAAYNGKHGTWNTTNIVIYSVIATILSAVVVVLALVAGVL